MSALALLKQQKAVVFLRNIRNYSYRDIGERLRISKSKANRLYLAAVDLTRRPASTALRPCPFCGAGVNEPINETPGKRPTWAISCTQFCITMRRGSRKQVVTDWNTRAQQGV